MARSTGKAAAGRPRGRRPGENQTRQAILDAARARFAQHGLDGATVRGIAADAGVDPSLVLHFFGSKAVLFAAATMWPFETRDAVERVIEGPRAQLGERLAAFFLSIWEEPEGREPILAMLRAAGTSPEAAELLRATLDRLLLGPLASRLEMPDAELRMSLCSAQLIGFGIGRYIVLLEPLASLTRERAVALLGPSLQRWMTAAL